MTMSSEKEHTGSLLQDLKREKAEKLEALNEVKALYSQFDVLKKLYADAQKQVDLGNEQRRAAEVEFADLKSKIAQLEVCQEKLAAFQEKDAEYVRAQEEAEASQKKMKAFQERETQYVKAQEDLEDAKKILLENQRLQDHYVKAAAAQEDAELRLRVAQQHLAKKVKETSELNDRVRSQAQQLQELQSDLDQARTQAAEQQSTADGLLQQVRRLQDQLQDAARSAEIVATRWEEKYFKTYEKWQENEMRLKGFRKFEEKYLQMQALLTSFGSLFENAIAERPAKYPSIPGPCVQSEDHLSSSVQIAVGTRFADDEDEIPLPRSMHSEPYPAEGGKSYAKGPYQNLFDMPRQIKRPKENLFE